jgi:DNA repair exonuclease SbcCD ATPase subunit
LKRTISAMRGPGSLKHNRRAFTAENVDAERTRYNVVYKDEPIKQVYHELFDDALERYNSKQKRKDRCISDYYEHLRTGKQEKVFHELIVQIGNKDNTGVTTEDGQWAATILDEYMQDFEKRNPTLRVFGAFLHMDEATPHLHIDFIPYVSGWKGKGMDTKVSLKQALKALGFAGGTKKESELNQWINAEKEQLAAVMERHGIEWEKKDTHEEHLSVLDFKKKERAKEVAELDAVKQEKQTELAQIQQQTQEAKRECQKQTKELNEIAPILQGLESLSAQYSQRPEEWVPEAGTFETAKSYRDKKAIPLINKLVKILYSLHHKYWKVKNECAKFMERYADEREANQNLRQRIEMLQEENTRLKAVEHNFGRVWSYYGAEQVKRVVELMAGRERAAQNVQRQKREHENVI